MTILLKSLMFFVSAAVAGKFLYIQHVFVKYNRALEQSLESLEALEGYYDAFGIAANGSFLHF